MEFMQIIVGNMKNFTYLVGDNETKNGFIIDPSYDIDKVISCLKKFDKFFDRFKIIFFCKSMVIHVETPQAFLFST